MAVWSRTKNELQRHIETTIRNSRGNLAGITHEERAIVFTSINEAIVDISLERGLDAPKVTEDDTTATTTADTNYVDLNAAVVGVIDGTVRIEAEDIILSRMDRETFYAYDPGEDYSSGCPSLYAIDTDGSGTMRLLLRDTPDAAYTINLKVETMPDEDSVSTLPGWYHGMLRSLSTAIALESLGLDGRVHQYRYNERLKNVREKQRGVSGPMHIKTRQWAVKPTAPELRATI